MGNLTRRALARLRTLGRSALLLAASALLVVAATAVEAGAQRAPENRPFFGARLGSAQHQSLYVGIARLSHVTAQDRSGQTLEFEYGRSGGQIGIGQTSTGQSTPQVRLQTVLLRTWGRATKIAPAQTFVGAEFQVSVLLGVSVGAYRRIRGSAPGDAHFVALRYVAAL